MADKQVVKALVVRIAGKDARLSIDDARKLYEALSELFDRPIVTLPAPHPDPQPYPWPYPIYVRPEPYTWWSITNNTADYDGTLRMHDVVRT